MEPDLARGWAIRQGTGLATEPDLVRGWARQQGTGLEMTKELETAMVSAKS
jgi:hypothetical protein